MKITKISYLFALCPAMLVGLTSCNKGPLPGKILTYDEAYAQVSKTAPEYNLRTSLAKSIDLNLAIEEFTIDGKVTVGNVEPTNIRFTLPKQDNFNLRLTNESGVVGALEVQDRVNKEGTVPNKALNSLKALNASSRSSDDMGAYNFLFNPFFTTYTLSYLHQMISNVADFKVINETFSLDGDNFYAQYSIPDLKTFTEMAEQYEARTSGNLFTVFRGRDGSVSLTLGFNNAGYLTTLNLKTDSNDMSLIGTRSAAVENFRGLAKINLSAKLTQNLYSDNEYRSYSVIDRLGNSQFNIRKPNANEYSVLGFYKRQLETKFAGPAFEYYDTILPYYGTDFVIEHPGKTSSIDKMEVEVNGITYPLSNFLPKNDTTVSYSYKANNATIDDGVTTEGRQLYKINENEEIYGPDMKTYYVSNLGEYTFLPNDRNIGHSLYYDTLDANLFNEILNLEGANGHKFNPIYSTTNENRVIDYFRFIGGWNENRDLYLGYKDDMDNLYVNPIKGNYSSTVNALPYGYVYYNFNMLDRGTNYRDQFVTKSSFAVMEDGSSHGILDIYNNLQDDGSYISPVIKPADGFEFNKNYINDPVGFKEKLIRQFGGTQRDFFYSLNGDTARMDAGITILPDEGEKWPEDPAKNLKGFRFKLSADYLNWAMSDWVHHYINPYHRMAFALTPFTSEMNSDNDTADQIFLRKLPDEWNPEEQDTFYIDFDMYNPDNPTESCFMFNAKNGLEKGTSKAIVKTDEKTGTKYLEFEDIVLKADDGYTFSKEDPGDIQSFMYKLFLKESERSGYENMPGLFNLLSNFMKVSNDGKEIVFSVNNVSEPKERLDLLNRLYEEFFKFTPYAKILFNYRVVPTSTGSEEGEGEKEEPTYMYVIPGYNSTYVQILPDFSKDIDKDLKFILDF